MKPLKPEVEEAATKLAEHLDNEILGHGIRVSPPLRVGDKEVVLVHLSDHRKQMLRIEAMAWVESMRRRVEQKIGSAEIRDAQVAWEELRGARWNAMMVQAATRKADDPEKHAFTMRELEEQGSSDIIGLIGAKYHDFEDEWDPDQVTPEILEATIELLKKNEVDLPVLWGQCGFATLSACLLTMGARLEKLETEQSSPISSIEE
jgi:hypothetical protein